VANCVYGDHVGGGDIHFFQMAQSAIRAGYRLHFFGGHALKGHLEQQRIAADQTLTDSKKLGKINMESLTGQFRLLFNYLGRFLRSLSRLPVIQSDDLAYAVTDSWFDALPVVFSRAKRKIMILGMDSPTLREIVVRGRPDVTATRLNSIYYWLSQSLTLRVFRWCRNKRILYVHPTMRERLLRLGYREQEMFFVSNGFNLEIAEQVPEQPKQYDAMWIGRVHRQKGLDDLLQTLVRLAKDVKDFRAVLVGKLDELAPKLSALGLTKHVDLPGLVSETEKFRLFKASRILLMPSHYESWGIVIAEAVSSGTPVVAYELAPYQPIFGKLVDYVRPFDIEQFGAAAVGAIGQSREGRGRFNAVELNEFKRENSWGRAGERFLDAVRSLDAS
jgi:glycosyltransferase involved in cell wall biosynthesis